MGSKRRRDKPTVMQVRCAIYTRKSTEEGLQQDFNSLDAQRDTHRLPSHQEVDPITSTAQAERGGRLTRGPPPATIRYASRGHMAIGAARFRWLSQTQRASNTSAPGVF